MKTFLIPDQEHEWWWWWSITNLHLSGETERHCQYLKFLVRKGINSERAWLIAGGIVIHRSSCLTSQHTRHRGWWAPKTLNHHSSLTVDIVWWEKKKKVLFKEKMLWANLFLSFVFAILTIGKRKQKKIISILYDEQNELDLWWPSLSRRYW
jgi:hypothetical protein